MAYRKIGIDTKLQAVMRVFRGDRVTAVAREMSLDRNSLASWMWRATKAVRANLEKKKTGADLNDMKRAGLLKGLRNRIVRQRASIKELQHSVNRLREGPSPVRCPACGCTRFYRNGSVMMELGNLMGLKMNGANRKIPVQKFSCVNCGKGVHLQGPPSLYHWVTGVEKWGSGESLGARRGEGTGPEPALHIAMEGRTPHK